MKEMMRCARKEGNRASREPIISPHPFPPLLLTFITLSCTVLNHLYTVVLRDVVILRILRAFLAVR